MMEYYDKFQLRIGNNMISSAIWCCQAWVKFSKKTKLNKSIGQVQLIIFEKFSKSLLFQIAREIMSLLIMYMKKHQSHDSQNFESIHVLFVICTLVSQSESYNFFMYILTIISKGLFNTPKKGLTSFGKSRQICCSIHRFCTATTLSIGSFRAQGWQWW